MSEQQLSHLDTDGRARMVDIGDKPSTRRVAIAAGRIQMLPAVVALVRADDLPKADVISTARIAGIMGAKRTSELIPLCHPLPLSSVKIEFEFADDAILITATATTTGATGVEMEALTAVTIAALTLHDMVKAVDPGCVISDVRLLEKTGGKTGHWLRGEVLERNATQVRERTAAVIVASTASAAGKREDTTGPAIAVWFAERGYAVDAVTVVADADIAAELARVVATRPAVIITTGGTGVSPSDRTPEATAALLDRELPGIAEAIRARGQVQTPTAALGRGLAGAVKDTIVVNLPGSPGGVRDGLAVLDELLEHLVAQLAGAGTHG